MTRALPVPLLAGVVVLLGVVLAVTLLVARQINNGTTTLPVSCTSQGACVPVVDGPYVAVRR